MNVFLTSLRVRRWTNRVAVAGLMLVSWSCVCPDVRSDESPIPYADGTVDRSYLMNQFWDDGKAEVAFYRVERNENQYGQSAEQTFVAGTYLVKHLFDPTALSKAMDGGGVSSFKFALFYEFESRSYEYKRAFVSNLRQSDLRPFKSSFTMFDWCSNTYDELSFSADNLRQRLLRTDDYGNASATFSDGTEGYPVTALPLVIRALDLANHEEIELHLFDREGKPVGAQVYFDGTEVLETEAGSMEAERIVVRYENPVFSMIGERTGQTETWWRSTSQDRLLVRVEGEDGRYRMDLIEQLRSPYWSENIFRLLKRITERP